MNKFCIDLDGVTLPDAIAAVVEAWYEAQNVENLIEQKNEPYQPGEPIEIRETVNSAWKRGWVFYKDCNAKVGICLAEKWNYELNKPNYLRSGESAGLVFADPQRSGCTMKLRRHVRKMVVEPWEKNQPQITHDI